MQLGPEQTGAPFITGVYNVRVRASWLSWPRWRWMAWSVQDGWSLPQDTPGDAFRMMRDGRIDPHLRARTHKPSRWRLATDDVSVADALRGVTVQGGGGGPGEEK